MGCLLCPDTAKKINEIPFNTVESNQIKEILSMTGAISLKNFQKRVTLLIMKDVIDAYIHDLEDIMLELKNQDFEQFLRTL